jgi:hypothetical protein
MSLALLFGNAAVIAQAAGEGAQPFIESLTSNAIVTWTDGCPRVVTAKGVSAPPNDPKSKLEEKMQRMAAQTDALRNLMEAVNGVRIDSTTTVHNFVTTNDEIKKYVSGFVNGAKFEEPQVNKDGWFETTVAADLCKISHVVLPKPSPRTDPLPQYNRPVAVPKSYTGLVIDARGTGARTALAPRILNKQGDEAYSVAYVEQRSVAEQGIAIYVQDLPSAQANPRVTSTPLLVKALSASGNNHTDLIISDADVQTIHGVPEHFKFLKQAKVLIVLDAK